LSRIATIAHARSQLPALVHSAEAGAPISLTRRGKPVAVLLSVAEYERLRRVQGQNFLETLQAFRGEVASQGLRLAEALDDVRDAASGRNPPW